MFSKFFNAIKSLFSSLFGASKKTAVQPQKLKPTIPDELIPQDGSEVKPDTIVAEASEMDRIVLLPNDPSKDFDEDIFEETEQPKVETPKPPVAEAKPAADKPADKPAEQPAKPVQQGRYLWCLDNGHGKKTPGKRSPVFDDKKTQFFEYEFNRDIVKRIIKQLDEKGIAYFNVVPEVDIDDFLEGRVNRANNKTSELPKLFVSVHSNASPAKSANDWGPDNVSGIETWFYHGSKRGQKMASIFQKYLIKETGFKNRHLKSKPEGQFYVLRKTKMTSVLTENGFYNNKKEAAELMKDEVRQKIADAHVAAIVEIEKDGI